MTDLILQIGVSKLGISIGLASVAWLAQRRLDRPHVSHLLWLLVLGTLVVPSVVSVPVPGLGASEPVTVVGLATTSAPDGTMSLTPFLMEYGKAGLVWFWLLGTVCVLSWSLFLTLRFHHGATAASKPASPELQQLASELAGKLGLASIPTIHTTRAHLSPMVWWIGGTARVLLPADLIEDMDHEELRWILAHELAHVRRRDHVIRWIEWLTCCVFWWNPVAWWARRQLRLIARHCLVYSSSTVKSFGRPTVLRGLPQRRLDDRERVAPGFLGRECGRASRNGREDDPEAARGDDAPSRHATSDQ